MEEEEEKKKNFAICYVREDDEQKKIQINSGHRLSTTKNLDFS